jgi:hypothetical protein
MKKLHPNILSVAFYLLNDILQSCIKGNYNKFFSIFCTVSVFTFLHFSHFGQLKAGYDIILPTYICIQFPSPSQKRGFWKDVGSIGVHFWWGVQPARRGVFLSYWLNYLNAANSDPTSLKWGGIVRGPKIPALISLTNWKKITCSVARRPKIGLKACKI